MLSRIPFAGLSTLVRKRSVFSGAMRLVHTEDTDSKTTITVLNDEMENYLAIDSYSPHGFRLSNGYFAAGPIGIFPKTVLRWNVGGVHDISPESLILFTLLEPKLDIIVLGLGDSGTKLDLKVLQYIRSKNISLEALPTERACATFNFLNSERRSVAAALIPPSYIVVGDEVYTDMESKKRVLISSDK